MVIMNMSIGFIHVSQYFYFLDFLIYKYYKAYQSTCLREDHDPETLYSNS